MVKQVIVVRKDLNMRKGKMCAQVAHASLKVWFDKMLKGVDMNENLVSYTVPPEKLTPEMIEWKEGIFTKIVVGCNSETELLMVQKHCIDLEVPYALIEDVGNTEFHGVKTTTCIAVGPADSKTVDCITGGFKLL